MTLKNGKDFSKVTVLYNEIDILPFEDKNALLTVAEAKKDAEVVAEALTKAGFSSDIFELNERSVDQVHKVDTNLFFNLCDGIGGTPHTESKVREVLDDRQLPYTGPNAQTIILTTNKVMAKQVFIQNNLPTPKYAVFVLPPEKLPKGLDFPLIVKPAAEDCSLGINSLSVVKNLEELQQAVTEIVRIYKEPALVEEYIDGREMNVTVVGNGSEIFALPISEILFSDYYEKNNLAKIVDFSAKWQEDSEFYKCTKGHCPADLDALLTKKIQDMAILAYKNCGCRDYSRVDIRLSKDNTPYLLEINADPSIAPEDGASRSARHFGWDYHEFIGQIASFAAKRYYQTL